MCDTELRVSRPRRPMVEYGRHTEERIILQRGRGSRRTPRLTSGGVAHEASAVAHPEESPYPSAPPATLQLLGVIDALLKAPPRPPRWALLKALAVLEEYRATGALESTRSLAGSRCASTASLSSLRPREVQAAASDLALKLRTR